MLMILKVFASPVASWHLQAFFTPQAFDFLVVDGPSPRYAGVRVACDSHTFHTVWTGSMASEHILILSLSPGIIVLGTAGLVENLAGTALTAAQSLAHMHHRIAYRFRAYPLSNKDHFQGNIYSGRITVFQSSQS